MPKRPDTEKEKAIDTVIELTGKYEIMPQDVIDRLLSKIRLEEKNAKKE